VELFWYPQAHRSRESREITKHKIAALIIITQERKMLVSIKARHILVAIAEIPGLTFLKYRKLSQPQELLIALEYLSPLFRKFLAFADILIECR
jgi:hypothetical protein